MNALIIDDEVLSRKALRQVLEYLNSEINILGEADSASSAYTQILEKKPDLIFLDIEMPGGSGFDLLAKFDEINFEVIFVTAYDQYALKAIRLCALDYLLKPINIVELKEAILKFKKRYSPKNSQNNLKILVENLHQKNINNQKIALPTQDGLEFVELKNILRIEADGRYSKIYFGKGGKLLISRNLKEFDNMLEDHSFFRVHHSHLVNLHFIKRYHKKDGGYLIMEDGTMVAISRRKKDEFLKLFQG